MVTLSSPRARAVLDALATAKITHSTVRNVLPRQCHAVACCACHAAPCCAIPATARHSWRSHYSHCLLLCVLDARSCVCARHTTQTAPCYANFYHQQLLAIDWARSSAAAELPINATAGVGVAGHSMGGQASVFAAAYNASGYNIKAAAMHHAFTHMFPAVQVPHLVFTGTEDTTAPPKMAENIFNAAGAFHARGLVNKVGASHSEPDRLAYNPKLALYTAAWFKLYIDGTPQWRGTDFDAMIHGNSTNSLCGGGDGATAECSVLP